jgi:lipid-binding SYLF domain-containing protein
MTFTRKLALAGLAAASMAASPFAFASDVAAKRAEIRKMCDEAVALLVKEKPDMKGKIGKAAGYGCFSSFGMSFLLGGAGGVGLVHANATKKDTYMNMGQATGGLDIGIKEYREVLVFHDAKTMQTFVDKGWEFAGSAGSAAKAGGKGAEAGEAQITSSGGIEVFSMTKTGLALGVNAGARKYWKDKDLNAGS